MNDTGLTYKALAIWEILYDCSVTDAVAILEIVKDNIFKAMRE